MLQPLECISPAAANQVSGSASPQAPSTSTSTSFSTPTPLLHHCCTSGISCSGTRQQSFACLLACPARSEGHNPADRSLTGSLLLPHSIFQISNVPSPSCLVPNQIRPTHTESHPTPTHTYSTGRFLKPNPRSRPGRIESQRRRQTLKRKEEKDPHRTRGGKGKFKTVQGEVAARPSPPVIIHRIILEEIRASFDCLNPTLQSGFFASISHQESPVRQSSILPLALIEPGESVSIH